MPVRCQISMSREPKNDLPAPPALRFLTDSKVLNHLLRPKVRTLSVIGPERAFTMLSEAARRDQ
jgi:hypothetical protein